MNRSKVALGIIVCLAVAVTLAVTFLFSSLSPSGVYHVGDFVTDHWQFVGYMLGGGSCYPKQGANFDNRQTGDVVSLDVLTPNATLTLGNNTYVCTSYYAPYSWYGNDPSTITLEIKKK